MVRSRFIVLQFASFCAELYGIAGLQGGGPAAAGTFVVQVKDNAAGSLFFVECGKGVVTKIIIIHPELYFMPGIKTGIAEIAGKLYLF
jgi:hypothetical protein